jgi:enamine deaminase RidA (YjgF/YER057c/UK114 family)
MANVFERLKALGIELPRPSVPSANYVPFRRIGNLLLVSGQVPSKDGKDLFVGRLGAEISLEQGQAAARICAVNLLAQVNTALDGNLDRVRSVVRLAGFVNATAEFGEHPKVINGASDLMVAVFGEAGKHVRVAVGSSSLPRNVPVEVEGMFEVAD